MEVVQNVESKHGPRGSPSDGKPVLSEELLEVPITLQMQPASAVGDLQPVWSVRVHHHEVVRPQLRSRTSTAPVTKLDHQAKVGKCCWLEGAVIQNLDTSVSNQSKADLQSLTRTRCNG
jgi:hypothetical protein